MANGAFQPILQQTSGVQSPQQPIQRSVDLSPLANLAKNEVRARQQTGGNQQEVINAVDTAALQMDLMDVQSARARGNVMEQELTRSVMALKADGRISDNEVEEWNRAKSKLEELKQFRRQGLGNDSIFQIRKNAIFKQAIQNNPMIYDEINTLFNGEISDPDTTAQTTAQAQITQNLDNRHGVGQWGLDEWESWKREQYVINNMEQQQALGTLDASNLSRSLPLITGAHFKGWLDKAVSQAGPGGVLGVEEETQLKNELHEKRIIAQRKLDEFIQRSQQQGKVMSPEQISSLRNQLNDHIDNTYASVLEGKDLLTRARAMQEITDLAIKQEAPGILRASNALGGGQGGSTNLELLNALVSNERLKSLLEETQHPWLKEVSQGQVDTVVADAFAFLFNPPETGADPGMRDVQDVLSATIMKQAPAGTGKKEDGSKGIPDQVTDNFVDSVDRRSKDETGRYRSGSVSEQLDILMDKAVSKNFNETANQTHKNSIAMSTDNMLFYSLNKAVEDMVRGVENGANIVYNQSEDAFESVTQVRSARMSPSFLQGGGAMEKGATEESAALLNKFMNLAENPSLKGIVPSKERIVNKFFERKEVAMEGLAQQQEEGEQQPEEGEDRTAQREEGDSPQETRTERQEKAGGFESPEERARRIPFSSPARVPGVDPSQNYNPYK